MSLTLPSEGQENWDEPLNAALSNLDERLEDATDAANDAAAAAQSALARVNHTGTQSADTITDGSTNKAFTATLKTKLDGIATGATNNSADANLLNRANHTGTQTAATISDFESAVEALITAAGLNPASEAIMVAVGDEDTVITTGTAKVTFRMPFAMNLTEVRASLKTASSSGTPTFDLNEAGVTVLSTKVTIDANEKTSTTAATASVVSDAALADDAEMTIDIDVAGTGATGPKLYLIGTRA